MILTGDYIFKELLKGNISIYPFKRSQINPNSYNYRLGKTIKVFDKFVNGKSVFKKVVIPKSGYLLEPGKMYLGNTYEFIGSKKYAMSLIGRSSMGRLGLFLQVSANLGHTTSYHRWTLEMVALKPIKIYPEMIIGQVSFWTNLGRIYKYGGKYAKINKPQESFININMHDFNRV